MKNVIILLAFAFGLLLPLMIARNAAHVSAQGQDEGGSMHVCVDKDGVLRNTGLTTLCPAGERSFMIKKADSTVDMDQAKEKEREKESQIDKTILDELNRRLNKLENQECFSPGQSKLVAPFVVFGRDGKRVFSVDNNLAGLFNSSQTEPVAAMLADSEGGYFSTKGKENAVSFGFNGSLGLGFNVYENRHARIILGAKSQGGNYSLKFFSGSGQPVAAIGVATDNTGLAIVGDQSGTKASIGLTKSGAGLVDIFGGKSVAQLTEGDEHHGGRLWIGNASGAGMVEAGDAGGYGIVKAGPLGFEFIPTPGLALPGYVIVGKR